MKHFNYKIFNGKIKKQLAELQSELLFTIEEKIESYLNPPQEVEIIKKQENNHWIALSDFIPIIFAQSRGPGYVQEVDHTLLTFKGPFILTEYLFSNLVNFLS